MSDVHLTRIADALEGLLAHVKKSPVFGLPVGGAKNPSAGAGASAGGDPKIAAKKAAEKAAAEKVAAEKAAAAAAAKNKSGPPAGTKAAGGKHTIEQVREIILKVATNESLGKQSAKDVLMEDGAGAQRVIDLKPENYDNVYDACQVLLSNEGTTASQAEPEDDLM
jgi:hypothetical protein